MSTVYTNSTIFFRGTKFNYTKTLYASTQAQTHTHTMWIDRTDKNEKFQNTSRWRVQNTSRDAIALDLLVTKNFSSHACTYIRELNKISRCYSLQDRGINNWAPPRRSSCHDGFSCSRSKLNALQQQQCHPAAAAAVPSSHKPTG